MRVLRHGCLFAIAIAVAGCGGSGTKGPGGGGGMDLAMAAAAPDMVLPRDMAKVLRDLAKLGPCDPVQQDCADPANKCTTIADPEDPMMQGLITQCVAITGMVGRDQTCVRTGPNDPPTANAGHDNCAAGFFCSSNGSLVFDFSQRHCRAFCRGDSDCKDTPTGKCVGLIQMEVGLCTPTCTPFGSDCPMGLDCSVLVGKFEGADLVTTCRGIGKLAIGAACMAATDCVAGTACIDPTGMGSPPKCTLLCDDNHPCPNGAMCARAMGLPLNGGVCR